MSDLLEHGAEPARRPARGLLVGLGAALLIAGIAIAGVLGGGRPVAAPSPSPQPAGPPDGRSGGPPASVDPGPEPEPEPEPVPDAPRLSAPIGRSLLIGTSELSRWAADDDTGLAYSRPTADYGWQLVPVRGGAVGFNAVVEFPPPESAVYFLPRSGRPRHIGVAHAVVAALAPDRVWFVEWRDGRTLLRRHDAAGRPAGPRVVVDGDVSVVGETELGLVVTQLVGAGTRLVDPATGETRPLAIDRPELVTPTAVVGRDPGCREPCVRPTVHYLRSGRVMTAPVVHGVTTTTPVVSPDGTRVAYLVAGRRLRPHILHLATARWARGPELDAAEGAVPAWSPDGRMLFGMVRGVTVDTAVVWRFGRATWEIVRTGLPTGVVSLVVV